jgi:uncharacterized lipoprotein YehR (DUF1307 family)
MTTRLLFGLILLAALTSCEKKEEKLNFKEDDALMFNYREQGGWSALNEELKVTKDAMFYSIHYRDVSSGEVTDCNTTEKTPEKLWKQLTNSFDV